MRGELLREVIAPPRASDELTLGVAARDIAFAFCVVGAVLQIVCLVAEVFGG